ncbi:MAG TPA: hypothetical protein VHP33_03515 [Polyangiaceae bacterium]|nr:hypothetical protein [Polyangiaceae bacterium]
MSRRFAARVTLGAIVSMLPGLAASACSVDAESGRGQTAGIAGMSSSAGNAVQPNSGSSSGGLAQSGSSSGGNDAKAGSPSGGSSASGSGTAGSASGGVGSADRCAAPGLTWKSARKTWYTSYPDPGSEECIEYNGCTWAGQFSACEGKKPEAWVSARNIVAAFPDYDTLALHDLCLKSGDKTLVVTVLDTCGDDDCDGCCTQNKGNADQLIDLESYTNERFGVEDGVIQWADLGPTTGGGCD